MSMKKSSLLLTLSLLLTAFVLKAQYTGPRLFLDVPSFYFHTPDVENTGHRLGAGLDVAMNVGTHWSVARLGLGTRLLLIRAPKILTKPHSGARILTWKPVPVCTAPTVTSAPRANKAPSLRWVKSVYGTILMKRP